MSYSSSNFKFIASSQQDTNIENRNLMVSSDSEAESVISNKHLILRPDLLKIEEYDSGRQKNCSSSELTRTNSEHNKRAETGFSPNAIRQNCIKDANGLFANSSSDKSKTNNIYRSSKTITGHISSKLNIASQVSNLSNVCRKKVYFDESVARTAPSCKSSFDHRSSGFQKLCETQASQHEQEQAPLDKFHDDVEVDVRDCEVESEPKRLPNDACLLRPDKMALNAPKCCKFASNQVTTTATNDLLTTWSSSMHLPCGKTNEHKHQEDRQHICWRWLRGKFRDYSELTEYHFWKAARAEFIGSFLFVLVSSYAQIVAKVSHQQQLLAQNQAQNFQTTHANLSFNDHLSTGLLLMAIVASLTQVFGQVCGCHLTPSITLALCASGKLSVCRLVVYIASQFLGSFFAALALLLITSSHILILMPPTRLDVSSSNTTAVVISNKVPETELLQVSLLPLALPNALPDTKKCSSEIFSAFSTKDFVTQQHQRNQQQTQKQLLMRATNECLLPNASQAFVLQLVACLVITMTFLANVERRRVDTGFKALSIGLAYLVGVVLTAHSGGLWVSPMHLLAMSFVVAQHNRTNFPPSLLATNGSEVWRQLLTVSAWLPQWSIHLIAAPVAGVLAAATHAYVDYTAPKHKDARLKLCGSFKADSLGPELGTCCCCGTGPAHNCYDYNVFEDQRVTVVASKLSSPAQACHANNTNNKHNDDIAVVTSKLFPLGEPRDGVELSELSLQKQKQQQEQQ